MYMYLGVTQSWGQLQSKPWSQLTTCYPPLLYHNACHGGALLHWMRLYQQPTNLPQTTVTWTSALLRLNRFLLRLPCPLLRDTWACSRRTGTILSSPNLSVLPRAGCTAPWPWSWAWGPESLAKRGTGAAVVGTRWSQAPEKGNHSGEAGPSTDWGNSWNHWRNENLVSWLKSGWGLSSPPPVCSLCQMTGGDGS